MVTLDRKKLILARYAVTRKKLEKIGVTARLASCGGASFTMTLVTSQDMSDIVSWAFLEWVDVTSVVQVDDETARYFTVMFEPEKEGYGDPASEED